MKVKKLQFGKGFKVVLGNRRVQAAQMVIEPGEGEGGPGNSHKGAEVRARDARYERTIRGRRMCR